MPLVELGRVILKNVLARTTTGDSGAKRVGVDAIGTGVPASNLRDTLAALYSLISTKAATDDLSGHTGAATGAHAATAISYAGSTNLSSANVEAALDELDTEKASTTALSGHTGAATGAHAATAISYAGSTNLVAATVEAALDELDTEKASTTELSGHTGAAAGAHAATAISYAGSTNLSSTTVEGALDELDTEKASTTALSGHTGAATGAHAATAISYAGSTNLSSTTVEAALDELDTEKQGTAQKNQAGGYVGLAVTPGTPDGTKYLRDDNTWQPVAGAATPAATTTTPGVIELADSSEATGLTDATRAMTPANVLSAMNTRVWKEPCRVRGAVNTTLTGEQTVDGIACVTGDRVLLTGQTDATQNGPWVVSTGAWTRPTDFDSTSNVKRGVIFTIHEGGSNPILFRLTTTGAITVGTTPLAFARLIDFGTQSSAGVLRRATMAEATARTEDTAAMTALGVSNALWTLPIRDACRTESGGALTLSGEQTVNGVACVTGDRVLARGQATASQNGIWVVQTGAWTRPTDFASGSVVKRSTMFSVSEGGGLSILFRLQNATDATVDTTALTFARYIPTCTTTVPGIVELADSSEERALTDATRAMTPAGTLNAMNTRAWKQDCRVRAAAQIALNNATVAVDGVTLVTGDRVLVTGQTASAENGIWVASTTAAWTRAQDADNSEDFATGINVRVREGTPFNIGRIFSMNSTTAVTVGTTAITFTTNPTGSVVSQSLDFGSIAAGRTLDLTVAVTGAAINDLVVLGPPALAAGLIAVAHVSAADTVTVRISNLTAAAIDPAAQTYKVMVIKQ